MKILKGNQVIAELPDYPKDFDCESKAGLLKIHTANGDVTLGQFDHDTASMVARQIHDAYRNGADSFSIPDIKK